MSNVVSESSFFRTKSSLDDASFALRRAPGQVSISKLFLRPWGSRSLKKYRFITIGLEEMDRNYLVALLGKELTLSQEPAGRSEVRMLFLENGAPCQFIIQRFDATKDGYEKTGLSLQYADTDRLLGALLVYRNYRHLSETDKEEGDRMSLDELVRKLEPIAYGKAKEREDTPGDDELG